MKGLIRKILFGNTEIREYSTITMGEEIKEKVFLETGTFTTDISKTHWVLCLQPVVFGIWLTKEEHITALNSKVQCCIFFSDASYDNLKIAKENAVAISTLDYVDKVDEADGTLYLLKFSENKIYHLSYLKTLILFFKYYKKPKLSFEKYKSLVTAYSYPRRVRIISFKADCYFNIFPMDLLGEIPGSGKYVFGLRHTNVTLAKIIDAGKIVVSEIPYTYKDRIYELGKHHSSSPPSPDSLQFKLKPTENFNFPVPEWADSYKEIQILKTKNLGSHMLLWGEIINNKMLKQPSGNLYHVHFLMYYHQKLRGVAYQLV